MADQTITTPPAGLSRRGLLARAGLAGAAALGTGLLDVGGARRGNSADAAYRTAYTPSTGKRFAVTDTDILTFALNTEYFEAGFYLHAVGGSTLPAADTSGIMGYGAKPNTVVAGGAATMYSDGPVPDFDGYIRQFFNEVAQDEVEHVLTLRTALGRKAPAAPAANYSDAFTTAMTLAGVIQAPAIFDPFASQRNFLLAAFLLNDIAPTAYVGAAPFLSNSADLAAAAGILGSEAYHAGMNRTLLFRLGQTDPSLIQNADQISSLRNATALLSAPPGAETLSDEGISGPTGQANIVPADAHSIVFARSFSALLSLFYLNTQTTLSPPPGGFAPAGFNGRIR